MVPNVGALDLGIADAGTASNMSVAIVHDYLNQCGGAERVALELAQTWPGAPIYTSLYRPDSTFEEFRDQDVRASVLDRLPVDRAFRALAPLYPMAFRSLGTLNHDVVVSSSSGWAHGVRTSPETLHAVYCHTPARWLYRADHHFGDRLERVLLAPFTRLLQPWDCAAAERADVYIANCENVRERIRSVYHRDAVVVHPPVNLQRFDPCPRGERLLVVSRLLPYKRVDLVVRAATRAGLGLDVIGVGPCMAELRALAGPTVEFHGRVDDAAIKEAMEGCRALCVAATEDFGIAPLEAVASGKPVVAYAAGGILETLEAGVDAALFHDLTEEAVLDAIARADRMESSPQVLAARIQNFSCEKFRERMHAVIEDAREGLGASVPAL